MTMYPTLDLVKVHSTDTHDFYLQGAHGDRQALYMIVSKGARHPTVGATDRAGLEKIHGENFPDKYVMERYYEKK